MVLQPIPQSAEGRARLAFNLKQDTSPALHIKRSTVSTEYYQCERPITSLVAPLGGIQAGSLFVETGELCYIVKSKFQGYGYVVVRREEEWKCSAEDERAASLIVRQVAQHRAYLESEGAGFDQGFCMSLPVVR